jgi:adenylosuccinate synthase
MKVDVILGLQWGDEGKGKIVDVMTPRYDIVARFQGGPNAGHTIEFKNQKFILHTIPSGIFYPEKINLVGNGVILDPFIFRKEIQNLESHGVDATVNLYISRRAHLILPTHRLLDAAQESALGASKIGSTLKGIGPTYTDKTARRGLRVGDITDPSFDAVYAAMRENHLGMLRVYNFDHNSYLIDGKPFAEYESAWLDAVAFMRGLKLIDSDYFIHENLAAGKRVLAEGAQGTMLDIDFGSYPFVTSSNTSVGGVCTGLGINPGQIGEIIGVFKAYCTRVGSGPFPTEQLDADGEKMRQTGREYGSTTGRPRRCGWIDMVALNYAIMLNGVTSLFMMKTDVLNDFGTIRAGVAYKNGGELSDHVPFNFDLGNSDPVYEDLEGWKSSLEVLQEGADKMPPALKNYIEYIRNKTGVPLIGMSYGPDREQTLFF